MIDNENQNEKPSGNNKPTLHAKAWEAHIAEIHLKGNNIKEAYHPLLFSLLSHIGQNSVLCSRSAMMAGDKRKAHDLLNYARLCAGVATCFDQIARKGIEGGAEFLEKTTQGEEGDPSKQLMNEWVHIVGQIPAKHLAEMSSKVLCALRYSEEGDFCRMKWDETLCGKNDYSDPRVKANLIEVMTRMGIKNETPPVIDDDEITEDTEDLGNGYHLKKTYHEEKPDADKKPKPPKGKKKSDDDDGEDELPDWMKGDRWRPQN